MTAGTDRQRAVNFQSVVEAELQVNCRVIEQMVWPNVTGWSFVSVILVGGK